MSDGNLAIWNAVAETDPAFTKKFSRGGGFSGTAVNPTYLSWKATQVFGPVGIGWGVDVVRDGFQDGAPMLTDGQVVGRECIHWCYVRVWYKHNGETGEVYHYGQTTFVGKNKYGPFTDEEAPKKSKTDGMSKCLAQLGFSADVHLGRYDDSKYVNDLRSKYQGDGNGNGRHEDQDEPPQRQAKPDAPVMEPLRSTLKDMGCGGWKEIATVVGHLSDGMHTLAQIREGTADEVVVKTIDKALRDRKAKGQTWKDIVAEANTQRAA